MALGATPVAVIKMIFRDSLRLVGTGLLFGSVAAFGLTRLITRFLFGIRSADPIAFITAVIALAAISALAAYIPARRATRVDPVSALRHE